jgi:hypothetical protein
MKQVRALPAAHQLVARTALLLLVAPAEPATFAVGASVYHRLNGLRYTRKISLPAASGMVLMAEGSRTAKTDETGGPPAIAMGRKVIKCRSQSRRA